MKIIEYEEKYIEDVKDLLVELEEYILSIDKDELDRLHPEYREKMAILDLEEVKEYNGKCYLAIEDDKAIGLIMGCIPEYDEYDYLDYKCPKRGEITELIVTNKTRSKGIGQLLINKNFIHTWIIIRKLLCILLHHLHLLRMKNNTVLNSYKSFA